MMGEARTGPCALRLHLTYSVLCYGHAMKRVLRTKSEKVLEGWRRLHTEKLRNLYVSPYRIRLIKLRNMKWAGHVARI
jgi:hypothetical protein